MNVFWYWAVEFLPMWMAPNLVTFIGFLFMLSAYGGFLFFDTRFEGDVPAWTFLWSAVAMFVYETLDAVDGKQARRTNSSSPMG